MAAGLLGPAPRSRTEDPTKVVGDKIWRRQHCIYRIRTLRNLEKDFIKLMWRFYRIWTPSEPYGVWHRREIRQGSDYNRQRIQRKLWSPQPQGRA